MRHVSPTRSPDSLIRTSLLCWWSHFSRARSNPVRTRTATTGQNGWRVLTLLLNIAISQPWLYVFAESLLRATQNANCCATCLTRWHGLLTDVHRVLVILISNYR